MKLQHAWHLVRTPRFVESQARDVWNHVRNSFGTDPYSSIYRAVRPYTMSGDARLRGLYDAVLHAATNRVAGDVVECGTARGGSAALLGLAMKSAGLVAPLWVFDSFEGMPEPTAADPDRDLAAQYVGDCRGDLASVRSLFERLGILDRARFVPGRFEDTVPGSEVAAIAVLHIDGDWYQSVKVCLDHFYDRVTSGGIIQIDDYGHWAGARKAVDEFMGRRGLSLSLRYLDYTGRQLLKP